MNSYARKRALFVFIEANFILLRWKQPTPPPFSRDAIELGKGGWLYGSRGMGEVAEGGHLVLCVVIWPHSIQATFSSFYSVWSPVSTDHCNLKLTASPSRLLSARHIWVPEMLMGMIFLILLFGEAPRHCNDVSSLSTKALLVVTSPALPAGRAMGTPKLCDLHGLPQAEIRLSLLPDLPSLPGGSNFPPYPPSLPWERVQKRQV